jgi:hypothetical protein
MDSVHIIIMSTIKLNHIELLTGSSNFEIWKHSISQVLQGEGYWGHVKGNVDIILHFPLNLNLLHPLSLPHLMKSPSFVNGRKLIPKHVPLSNDT